MSDIQPGATQSPDSKTIAILLWVGTIFLWFVPGLVIFLTKKDDPYLLDQSREALNWSITVAIGWAVGVALSIIFIGVFVLLAVGILNLVFCVLGAIKASNGEQNFRVPFTLRLIK